MPHQPFQVLQAHRLHLQNATKTNQNPFLNLFDMLGLFTECPPKNPPQSSATFVLLISVFRNMTNFYKWWTSMTLADKINANMEVYGAISVYFMKVIDAIILPRGQWSFWTQISRDPPIIRTTNGIISLSSSSCFVFSYSAFYLPVCVLYVDYTMEYFSIVVITRLCHIAIIQYLIYMDIIIGQHRIVALRATS